MHRWIFTIKSLSIVIGYFHKYKYMASNIGQVCCSVPKLAYHCRMHSMMEISQQTTTTEIGQKKNKVKWNDGELRRTVIGMKCSTFLRRLPLTNCATFTYNSYANSICIWNQSLRDYLIAPSGVFIHTVHKSIMYIYFRFHEN